ncbi:ABC transporter substrate-binding protein [Phyllobacterium sp. SYP-B3895]|uniref:ABC transporter substrate-binding protein n=1 Tax=Phyllobacterium sp. SYP-B3895 TaxID=2663240 RepID=UPI001299860F|nr:ABC transporter substrate-binding protein [Phyllobacterium sp. SYP-B3895]MRG57814.1 ABC transporter substrate-binding protein [Phyllobacterium sp. SYP-B3895]
MKPKRRHYLDLAIAFAMSFAAIASAQQPSVRTPRIGLLAWWPCEMPYTSESSEFGPLMRGLVELGHSLGELSFECRSASKHDSGLAAAAAELVQHPVDVIVTSSQPAAHAAYNATHTIPIVTIISGDPVAAGLAISLAKPGGNLTGVTYYANELAAKRLELLKEAVPELATVGMLANPVVSYIPFETDAKDAANRLGIAVSIQHVSEPDELDTAFSRMEAAGVQAVFVLPDLMLASQSSRIAALAIEHRLPTMAWGPWFVADGCLMAYSARYREMEHRLAFYVDRILKGSKPGDLPIEQPTKFDLSINLKTAKALGIDLPQTLLVMADEVVE